MSTDLIPLAFVMFAATYPTRALGLLAPAFDRLPKAAIAYRLRRAGELAALAAVAVMVRTPDSGPPVFYIGIEWVAVLASPRDRGLAPNLLLGLVGRDRRGRTRDGAGGNASELTIQRCASTSISTSSDGWISAEISTRVAAGRMSRSALA